MLIYLTIASIIYWGGFTRDPKLFYRAGICMITALSALRNIYIGGFDAFVYADIFRSTPVLSDLNLNDIDSEYSPGYILLNSIIRTFSSDYETFQVVYVLLTMWLLVIIFRKLHLSYQEKCILLFSYFCFRFIWYEWVLLRQNLANIFFWLFIVMYYENRYSDNRKRYLYLVLMLLVPPLFHKSALLNIILVPLAFYIEKTNIHVKRVVIPILSVFVFIVSSALMNMLAPYITMFGERYEHYSENAAMITSGTGNILNYMLRMVFYVVLLINWHKDDYKYKDLLITLMVMVLLIGSVNFSSMNRVYEYYAIAMYLVFTFSVRYIGDNVYRIGYWLLMLIILGRFLNVGVEGSLLNYSIWL